ncbi:uncharacterized protein LOC129579094 [Sitodiplosis mosellana]|uniref:uncharacterized protein LOC129579094 n=1 Tax=Sitodiplosis mosellana TaxID=263140 RepID=UPI0024447152|nr:uncharacterized protein LOC129579094 [Sitodiplosis mosellana]
MERHIWRIVDSIQHINITALNTQRILSHNQYEYLPNMMKDIAQNMPKMVATLCKYTDMAFWMFIKNNSQVCHKDVVNVLSENQALAEFYVEILAALLKCYMLLQMTYMVQTVNDLGNFNDPADQLRESFTYNVTTIQNYVIFELKNASRAVWACDPDDFNDPDSYIEITRFYQGIVENEINLNPEAKCQQTCEEYTETKHYHCAEDSFCDHLTDPLLKSKLICNGTILNCRHLDSSFNICPAEESSARRYNFLEYDDGSALGGESNCNRLHVVRANSWWSWFVHCSNCFCYCDEPGIQSDRYFSLRSVVSNTNENKVISGVGFTKVNRIIQLKISERELLPNGTFSQIDVTNMADQSFWRTSKEFSIDDYDVEEGVDYHTLSWFNRSIDLDTVIDDARVVTGVRFRVVNSHIRLEVRVTNFNYQTGKLIDIQRSEWLYNKNSTEKKLLELQYPDRSTRSKQKSIPIHGKNHYINFQSTDMNDASQSTVPFLDSHLVESQKPLAGVGLYYKTQFGYGGFIAAKLIVFDASLDITPINNF